MIKIITPLLAAALLAGCASSGAHYAPMVDTGQRIGDYNADLAECQQYAQRAQPVSGERAALDRRRGRGINLIAAGACHTSARGRFYK